jgi:hypothetical protein
LYRAQSGELEAGSLVKEHVVPIGIYCAMLLDQAAELGETSVIAVLNRYGLFAIVTKQEDAILNRRFRAAMPDAEVLWSRYIAEGFNPSGFESLFGSAEWEVVHGRSVDGRV